MKTRFSAMLSQFVTEYVQDTRAAKGVTEARKGKIAERANITAVRLSHLLSGERAPRSRDEVLAISTAIELTVEETNALLEAAEFARLSELEQTRGPEASVQIEKAIRERAESLQDPDRGALADMMARDSEMLIAAWDEYLAIREDLYRRRWHSVVDEVDRLLPQKYWRLRQMASRYYAYVQLLRVAAELHRGDLDEALGAASAAREAAEIAADPMLLCRTEVRLGDAAKASGHLVRAGEHYAKAHKALDQWINFVPGQSDLDPLLSAREAEKWIANWRGRILRKQGTLSLIQGEPYEALAPLQRSVELFRQLGNRYELSRACYGLGWAHSTIGRWEDAQRWHQMGLDITIELNEGREEWEDRLQLVEGYLCVASDFLYRRDYGRARELLDKANKLFEGEDLKGYHEYSRLQLLYGRYYLGVGGSNGIAIARDHFEAGIRFDLSQKIKDPVRLASLYNALGTLELADRNWLRATDALEKALSWIGEADPPNHYYRAMILINWAGGQIRFDEMPDQTKFLSERILESRELAEKGKYWRQMSKVESVLAEYCSKLHHIADATHHAALAVIYGCKFNRWIADEAHEWATAWTQRLTHGETTELRERLIEEIMREAPSTDLSDTEQRELQRILQRMAGVARMPVRE